MTKTKEQNKKIVKTPDAPTTSARRIVREQSLSEGMTEQDMTDLLTIYSTQETLQDIVESLIGEKVGCGPGEGICGDLGRVYGIIKRHSVLPANEDPLSSFEESPLGRVLANREMNNRRKAQIILGLE